MKTLNVACAIIRKDGRILVVQRSEAMKLPLKWEFPGGKIEVGESDEACIKREIKEELNIDIDIVSRLNPADFDYPDFSIHLIPFVANFVSGEVKLTEHKQYLLITKEELEGLDWAEADIPVLDQFLRL